MLVLRLLLAHELVEDQANISIELTDRPPLVNLELLKLLGLELERNERPLFTCPTCSTSTTIIAIIIIIIIIIIMLAEIYIGCQVLGVADIEILALELADGHLIGASLSLKVAE